MGGKVEWLSKVDDTIKGRGRLNIPVVVRPVGRSSNAAAPPSGGCNFSPLLHRNPRSRLPGVFAETGQDMSGQDDY